MALPTTAKQTTEKLCSEPVMNQEQAYLDEATRLAVAKYMLELKK